jgi:hypothetical protein
MSAFAPLLGKPDKRHRTSLALAVNFRPAGRYSATALLGGEGGQSCCVAELNLIVRD